MEARDHGRGNLFRKMEIAQVGAGFIGIQACDGSERIIFQHAGNAALRCLRI